MALRLSRKRRNVAIGQRAPGCGAGGAGGAILKLRAPRLYCNF